MRVLEVLPAQTHDDFNGGYKDYKYTSEDIIVVVKHIGGSW